MIDLLLCFPDVATAGQVGEQLGCAKKKEVYGVDVVDGVDGWVFATNHTVAICPVGPHYFPSGQMADDSGLGPYPVMESDKKFWALARIMVEMPVPEVLASFIVERDADDVMQPQRQWA